MDSSIWYSCRYCKKVFAFKKDLLSHKLQVHRQKIMNNVLQRRKIDDPTKQEVNSNLNSWNEIKQKYSEPPIVSDIISNAQTKNQDENRIPMHNQLVGDTRVEVNHEIESHSVMFKHSPNKKIKQDEESSSKKGPDQDDKKEIEICTTNSDQNPMKDSHQDVNQNNESTQDDQYDHVCCPILPPSSSLTSFFSTISSSLSSKDSVLSENQDEILESDPESTFDDYSVNKRETRTGNGRFEKKSPQRKEFECDDCGKSYSNKVSLVQHQRFHTETNLKECHYCQKKFLTQSHLTVHLRYHTGERPFKCHLCSLTFSSKSNLKIHVRSQHKRC